MDLLGDLPERLIPPPDDGEDGPGQAVRFDRTLRDLLARFVASQLARAGSAPPGSPSADSAERCAADLASVFQRVLQAVLLVDRRQGLANLCWLAHSRQAVAIVAELEAASPAACGHRGLLAGRLSFHYRRVADAARQGVQERDPGRLEFLRGHDRGSRLTDALVADGLAFVWDRPEQAHPRELADAARRGRLDGDLFEVLRQLLAAEAARRIQAGERVLVQRAEALLPGCSRTILAPGVLDRLVLHPEFALFVAADPLVTGPRLAAASARVGAEAEGGRLADLLDAFLETAAALRRFELIARLREKVIVACGQPELEDRMRRRRFFDFSELARISNDVVEATVLFLDLRGFTETSEGQISAGDLTHELYRVFDHFVPHLNRFGATVDKFLGDGIMATWGTRRAEPMGPLQALRAAVSCQETLGRLRRQRRTAFRMGVSVHYGPVSLARFIAGDDTVQDTVIGRNVNLAGRLSAAARQPGKAAGNGDARQTELQVEVDIFGTLSNEGIVISGPAIEQIGAWLTRSPLGEGFVLDYADPEIGRHMLIRYAGDARFKGVAASLPVYEVDFVR